MPDKDYLTVAAAQIESVPNDLRANCRNHLEMIARARDAGVDALLFPEMSLTGHGAGSQALALALDRDHPMIAEIARASADMCTIFGIIEEAAAAQFYNTAVVVRDGRQIFQHRKVNLATYGRLEDGKHFAAGNRIDTLALGARWRAGLLICADTWNPALVHLTALQRATLLLAPISSAMEAVGGEFDNPGGWEVNLRFHAMTYGMPVVMANRVGKEGDLTFWGGSRILDPFGRCLAQATGSGEELVVATLDYQELRRARYLLPTLRDANLPLVLHELERLARLQSAGTGDA